MDMNRSFFLRKEDINPQWRVIDAKGKVLGRLATEITNILRGKDQAFYTPHTDSGDYVVIVNASEIVLTGNKWDGKEYESHSGWIGGLKTRTAREIFRKDPTEIIFLAVKRMLPKNRLSREMFRKLKVYAGAQHPHIAQVKTVQ